MKRFSSTLLLMTLSLSIYANDDVFQPFTKASIFDGHLGYLDYGTKKNVQIPLEITFTPSSDSKHLIVDKVYTDPGYKVHSLSVISLDVPRKIVREVNFDSPTITESTYDLVSYEYVSSEDWSFTFRGKKRDDDREAIITKVERLSDKQYTSETIVDYLDTPEEEKLKRNWIEVYKIE